MIKIGWCQEVAGELPAFPALLSEEKNIAITSRRSPRLMISGEPTVMIAAAFLRGLFLYLISDTPE